MICNRLASEVVLVCWLKVHSLPNCNDMMIKIIKGG